MVLARGRQVIVVTKRGPTVTWPFEDLTWDEVFGQPHASHEAKL